VSGYYQAGFTWDGFTLPFTGVDDVFVARFAAADGAIEWLRTATGAGEDGTFGIASHGSDRIAVSIEIDTSAHVIDRDLTAQGTDGTLFVLDGSGTPLQVYQLGGAGTVDPYQGGVSFDPSGRHIAQTFNFTGGVDIAALGLSAMANGTSAGGVLVVDAP
jgi:hypothetical protein